MQARKEEEANDEDVTKLLLGCNIENYEWEAKRHNSEITGTNSNCYDQVGTLKIRMHIVTIHYFAFKAAVCMHLVNIIPLQYIGLAEDMVLILLLLCILATLVKVHLQNWTTCYRQFQVQNDKKR